jgi:3-keto-disaccharide hydrolase
MTTLPPANNRGTEDTGGQPAPGTTNDRVQTALREFLERIDRGESPDRDDFIAKRPEIAKELRSCLEAEEQIRKLARAGGPSQRSATSTQSFALHGQETIAPQGGSRRTESGSGLKQHFGRYRIIKALGKGAMGYGRKDRNVRPGEWFTLEVIVKGSRTVIKVNGKGPTNYHWNTKDRYVNGGHLAFEQHRDQPPVEIRRIEIKEFGSTKAASNPSSGG